MAELPDHYASLGISPDATPEEIRYAYHKAALHLHPDVNFKAGDTDLFLNTQVAYKVLSDPVRRADYDRSRSPGGLALQRIFSRSVLACLDEPQRLYVLLGISIPSQEAETADPPLNLGLVLDRSTSMRGERLDTVKMATIQLIRQLRPQDKLSVVIFNDRAETLQTTESRQARRNLETQIQMLQPGGGTEIFRGLEAGFFEVRRSLRNTSTNHLILLTDGRTYGDEADCLKLAEDAGLLGIGLTCLGIGADWNDALLDRMAALTGGSSVYISQPAEIKRFFNHKLDSLRQWRAGHVELDLDNEPGIELASAFRLAPEAIPLPARASIPLGSLGSGAHLAVMLEFILPALALDQSNVPIASGLIRFSLPGQGTSGTSLAFQLWRPARLEPEVESPPEALIQILSQLNLYRMQERARQELAEGSLEAATRRLQNLATNLLTRGELELAQAVFEEANRLQQGLPISAESDKRIKYGTRALLLPGTDGIQKD